MIKLPNEGNEARRKRKTKDRPEQRCIVLEVERRLSVTDEVARTVEHSLAQAERLRQSILKKAFEGKLVAQDASDEPAGVLQERIRQQKANK